MTAPEQQQPARASLAAVQQGSTMPDQKIDMFSLRGFELAQRIARMYATSDAVPACFRSHNMKKVGKEEHWVENTSALGNCLVAIETAQAVGMSITAVMQNANIIEGKLSWSAQFVIAAVNASRRFTPLRFHMVNRGKMTAKYKEKIGWNDQTRRVEYADREVEIENWECTAWALPSGTAFPANVVTLDQARAAGVAVVEGAPVSIAMAVEEGWYSKAGSKWQTSMRSLMLQYRAGAFFGRIHAPDVVMGMGRTSEEAEELIDLNEPPAAAAPATPATVNDLRQRRAADAEVVEPRDVAPADPEPQQNVPAAPPASEQTPAAAEPEADRAAKNDAAVAAAIGGEATKPQARTRRSAGGAE
jgi:hypothetical protein